MKVISVVGARPNFVKIAPLMKEFRKNKEIDSILLHTGQHYDELMNDTFFEDLDIPVPKYNLKVGSASHAVQTAKIMQEFEKVCLKENPDLVLVVGDVNSTLACSLVASKLGIKTAHVEAGLRSWDRTMPEEINRILTDAVSDFLFVTEPSGLENLKRENASENKIFFVGNIMIDSLIDSIEKIKRRESYKNFGLDLGEYAVVTLHRPSNVDSRDNFSKIIESLESIQQKVKVIWPMHPRAKKNMEEFGLAEKLHGMKNLRVVNPLNYLDFMNLVTNCKFVITDSGGIQEETTYLRKPCITLRQNTERPITIEKGTNILAEIPDIEKISTDIINDTWKKGTVPDLWDGRASERITKILIESFHKN